MINLKLKHCDPATLQSRIPSSPDGRANPKKLKDIQLKPSKSSREGGVIPVKRKQHLASRSTIEMVENKHYNSPNFETVGQAASRKTNQFTFTDILQQSARNGGGDSFTVLGSKVSDISYSCNYSNVREVGTGRNTGSNMSVMPETMSVQEGNRDDGKMVEEKSIDKSINQSKSKSPFRLVNANKLNNTPKINQNKCRPRQDVRQAKTFAEVLRKCNQIAEIQVNESNEILEQMNLECSQKIDKFQGQLCDQSQVRPQQSAKAKSKLLSTGIINLSQPFEGSQICGLCGQKQSNKQDCNRDERDRLLSQGYDLMESNQTIIGSKEQLFLSKEQFLSKIQELEDNLQQLNSQIKEKAKLFTENQFVADISSSFNPQINSIWNCSQTVDNLIQVGNRIQAALKIVVDRLQRISKLIVDETGEYVSALRFSSVSQIDWMSVENLIKEKDSLEDTMCRNEFMRMQLKDIEAIVKGSHQVQDIRSLNDCLKTIQNKMRSQQNKLRPNQELDRASSQWKTSWNKRIGGFWDKMRSMQQLIQDFQEILHH